MTEQKGKWLVVTNNAYKSQVKREVERILKGTILQIIHPIYTQPENISKEHRNPTLVAYATISQASTENGHEITNLATPRQRKKNYIVLFNILDNESYPKLPQKKKITNKQEEQDNNSLSNETTTTRREELQETISKL